MSRRIRPKLHNDYSFALHYKDFDCWTLNPFVIAPRYRWECRLLYRLQRTRAVENCLYYIYCIIFHLFISDSKVNIELASTCNQAHSHGGHSGSMLPPIFCAPPNFVVFRKCFTKTYNKSKNLAPLKMYFAFLNLKTWLRIWLQHTYKTKFCGIPHRQDENIYSLHGA